MSIAIKPVRFTENGFMAQPFALGGEGAEGLDPAVNPTAALNAASSTFAAMPIILVRMMRRARATVSAGSPALLIDFPLAL